MKSFHQNQSEGSRPVKKPKHFACPEGKAFIELKGQTQVISVLLDSSSIILLMN